MSIRLEAAPSRAHGWIHLGAVVSLWLLSAGGIQGQSVSTGTTGGGSGSFGLISGGGGSYGSLTLGVTADQLGPHRVPINVNSMADGSANTVRKQPWERVPINARTMADGTANGLLPRREEPVRRDRRRGPPLTTVPFAYRLYPTRYSTGTSGAAPSRDGGEARGEVGGPRTRRERAGRLPRLPDVPSPRAAAGSSHGAGDVTARRNPASGERDSRAGMAPRVQPPEPGGEGASTPLSPGDCAEARITTAGGIQWRQRVSVADFDANAPEEVASRLQRTLDRGEPLSISGPDGSFTVPADLVRGLIVGPCRDF